MPAVANSIEWRWASERLMALDGALVAMVMIVCTLAARARSRTAGRSAANCSSSRCACVSMRAVASGHARLRLRRGEFLQPRQMPALEGQKAFHLRPCGGIFDRWQVALKVGNRPALMFDQARQKKIERQEIDGREVGGIRRQIRQRDAVADEETSQAGHRLDRKS